MQGLYNHPGDATEEMMDLQCNYQPLLHCITTTKLLKKKIKFYSYKQNGRLIEKHNRFSLFSNVSASKESIFLLKVHWFFNKNKSTHIRGNLNYQLQYKQKFHTLL